MMAKTPKRNEIADIERGPLFPTPTQVLVDKKDEFMIREFVT